MKETRFLIGITALVYVVAWFAPVDNSGELVGEIRGWQAFFMALSPIWDNSVFTEFATIFAPISALTNVLFVMSVGIALLRPQRLSRIYLYGLLFSCIINAIWMQGDNLRVGYYLWLASFVLLAIGAYWIHQMQPRPPAAA